MKKLCVPIGILLALVILFSVSGVCQIGGYDWKNDGSSDSVGLTYELWKGTPGRYTRSYIGCFPTNVGKMTVSWYLRTALLRTMWLPPGGAIFDDLLCDSILVVKDVATDSVSLGAGRP
jgi:hypothetical protein